ncbi:unnamed protein product [Cyprideis torosa]|uniref:Uncharacterized protein n=1 Tax=Cyprideis torosa TaxID=163714 RepID=A0A7R8WEP9_9CRUS|nr:unnamed protein product [Cyprideis torosa]CAG0890560.1 unnamed protein product [Cyprideis torosa]
MNCENPIREPRIRNFVCETEERREGAEEERCEARAKALEVAVEEERRKTEDAEDELLRVALGLGETPEEKRKTEDLERRLSEVEDALRQKDVEVEEALRQKDVEVEEALREKDGLRRQLEEKEQALEQRVRELQRKLDEAEKENKEERERQRGKIILLTADQLSLLKDMNTARQLSGFRLGEFEIHLQTFHRQLYLVMRYSGSRPVRVSAEVRLVATKVWSTPSKSTYHEDYMDGTRQKSQGYVLGSGDLTKVLNAYTRTSDSFHFEVRILQVVPSAPIPESSETGGVLQAGFPGIPTMVPLDEMYSGPHFLRNTKCRISIQREPDHLGIWVECLRDLSGRPWSFKVTYTLTLNRARKKGKRLRTGTWIVTQQNIFGGWVDFIFWKELVDPGNGWLSGGAINVTANVKINDV